MNIAILTGHIGQDAEVRSTEKNDVIHFSVATNESWVTADGEKKEETLWHRVEYWVKKGSKIIDYLKKGTEVIISGKTINSTYIKKIGDEDVKFSASVVRVNKLEFNTKSNKEA